MFYVPPLSAPALDEQGNPTEQPRIPLAYLESLFGQPVRGALDVLKAEREKSQSGGKSELMDLLIAYDWHQNFKLSESGHAQAHGKISEPSRHREVL